MTDMEFVQGIALLSASVGKEMPDSQVDAWFAILGDLSPSELRTGIVETLRHHQFAGFPPVATILANAGVTRGVDDEARLAWGNVRMALGKYGCYDSIDFGEKSNATVRHLGGWQAFGETLTSEIQWLEKRFIDQYKAVSTLEKLPDGLGRHLVGFTEAQNRGIEGAEFPLIQLSDGQTIRHVRRIETSPASKYAGIIKSPE